MLGNFTAMALASLLSMGTFFSPPPKMISPVPVKQTIKAAPKQKTVLAARYIPPPTLLPTATPTPTPLPTRLADALTERAATPTTVPPNPTPTALPTPTPTDPTNPPTGEGGPTPTPTIVTSEDLENMFTTHSNHYSVDKEMLKKIARCESGFNAAARTSLYGGMFQFSESSWVSTRSAMGMDTNVDLRFNADEAIRTAAFKISTSGTRAWPSCSL